MAYRHLLVGYEGTSEGDQAVLAADELARINATRLTVAVVVTLEETYREFDCDAVMLPARPQRLLARMLLRDRADAISRRASCVVLRPA